MSNSNNDDDGTPHTTHQHILTYIHINSVFSVMFRFGKFTQLQFNDEFRMAGSGCTTYLLEKSRVVGHEPGERAYHVFYQVSCYM